MSKETKTEIVPKILKQQLEEILRLDEIVHGAIGREVDEYNRIKEILSSTLSIRETRQLSDDELLNIDQAILQLTIALANISTTIVADTEKKFRIDEKRRELLIEILDSIFLQKK